MEEIEEGQFFPIHTENRKQALKFLLKQLRRGSKDKGQMVKRLNREEIYKQKKDCRDFIQNCIKSTNIEIVSISQRLIALTAHPEAEKQEVKKA